MRVIEKLKIDVSTLVQLVLLVIIIIACIVSITRGSMNKIVASILILIALGFIIWNVKHWQTKMKNQVKSYIKSAHVVTPIRLILSQSDSGMVFSPAIKGVISEVGISYVAFFISNVAGAGAGRKDLEISWSEQGQTFGIGILVIVGVEPEGGGEVFKICLADGKLDFFYLPPEVGNSNHNDSCNYEKNR